ncbi:hypothetical protein HP567_012865 [Brevibacillus sp. M2.1A]|uniref:hypothetical protein n=1 Tax=Brevibacillus sp. M2.1A TaxID=2738980 RepID=UPI00156AE0C7|nr:hypothetical protein [Brevibacillus sp. M2.1A]MCC8435437.1 hypothetical protein [Brevibacillus sp. M2.1A]
MDLVDIVAAIRNVATRLDGVPRQLHVQAKEYASAERDYRIALRQEMLKLRAEGLPATLITDVARGNVAELKFKRDLAESLFKSASESSKALQAELSGLQSIYRRQDEM